jgi:hypothetical protein
MVKEPLNRNSALILLLCFAAGLAGLVSCNKGGVCVSNSGPVILQERPTAPFDSIDLADNVNLILTQDSVDKITVEAGNKVIGGITTEVLNRQLIIRNHNTCNWLRSYDKPLSVHVSVKKLWKIYYNGAGNISTTNTLKGDSVKLEIWGGCGTVNLELDYNQGWFGMFMGTADFNLHGRCDMTSFYLNNMGLCQTTDLVSKYCSVTSRGSNDCYVNVRVSIWAVIENIGSVYYTGNPPDIGGRITGTGVFEPFNP